MTNEINFDELAKKANDSGGAKPDLNNLFGSTFALPKWYFIARGELPNVNPYVASRADYMNGQQMIRAFTDTKRLHRFAKENNLLQPDGTAQMLEIPVGGIIEYLEQFIQYGVGGIWFNSDMESDGFSLPLKQLRPVSEHLAQIGWKSIDASTNPDLPHNSGFVPPQQSGVRQMPMETVAVILNDGLMLPSGFYKAATYAFNFYCLVPRDWTEKGELKAAYLEKFYEKFYGVNWRNGNSDGSRYVVDHSFTQVLTPEVFQKLNFTETFDWNFQNDEKNHYWLCIADQNGEIRKASPPEFQKAFNEFRKTSVPAQPPTSKLEDWGFSNLPNGDVDLRIKFFRSGTVKFGVSLVPFYAAITSLLKDYQGAGDFQKIFNFAPEAMKDVSENFTSNDHGKYFRIRRFQYHPPNAAADVATIDSNQLRHIRTGTTLTMSFAVLNIPDTSSASLYFGFEGGRGEVEKLLSAVKPALDDAGFVAEENT